MRSFSSHRMMTFSVRPGILRHPSVILVLISLFILPTLLLYSFHSDVDIHHCIGLVLYRNHWVPNLETTVVNFPGMVIIHALSIQLFGNNEAGFRFVEMLWQIATLFSLYWVSRLWISQGPALLGCLFFALFYVYGPDQLIGQPDGFAVLPLVLAIGLMIRAHRASRLGSARVMLIVAGILYAMATTFRPTFMLLLWLPLLFLFDLRTPQGIQRMGFVVLAFAASMLLVELPLAFVPNALHEEYLSVIRYNIDVYSHVVLRDYSRRAWVALGLIVGWALIIGVHRRTGRNFAEAPHSKVERRFLIASFLALAIVIISGFRFTGYHFIPFFSLFMPILATIVWEWTLRLVKRRKVVLTFLILALAIGFYPWKLLLPVFRSQNATPFSAGWHDGADFSTWNAANYVMQHTNPNDAVEVATFCPDLRWRIGRPTATRFTTPYWIATAKFDGSYTDYQRQWQDEYVDSLQSIRPKYYVVYNLVDYYDRYSMLDVLYTIRGLKSLLVQDYRLDTTIGRYWLYKRK